MQHREPSPRPITTVRRTLAVTAAPALVAALGAFLSGCGEHPTRAECDAFAEHYIELAVNEYEAAEDQAVARESAEGAKGMFVNHCTDAGSKEAVACAMKATNIADYRECFPKKPEDTKDDSKKADSKKSAVKKPTPKRPTSANKKGATTKRATPTKATPPAKATPPTTAPAAGADSKTTPPPTKAAASTPPAPAPAEGKAAPAKAAPPTKTTPAAPAKAAPADAAPSKTAADTKPPATPPT